MKNKTIAISDCDHLYMAEEQAVCDRYGLDYVLFQCKTEDDLIERLPGYAEIHLRKFLRQKPALTQKTQRLFAKRLNIDFRPAGKGLERAHRVNTANETPHPFQHLPAIKFRRPAALPGEHGKTQVAMAVQRFPVEYERRDHRQLPPGKFRCKRMLLKDRCIRPASGTIKLNHPRRTVVHENLIDAVLITVECQQTTIGRKANALQRIEQRIGRERRKWCCIDLYLFHLETPVRLR